MRILIAICLLFSGCKANYKKTGGADPHEVGPERLTAVPADAAVILEWSPVVGADSYTLYVWAGIPPTSYEDAVRITSVSSPYKHEQLQNGTTYTYAVTATTSRGETLLSSIVTATPSVAADHQEVGPERLTAVPGNAMVTLEWSPVVGADSYTLYVWAGIPPTSYEDAVRITSVSSPYKHEQLQNGTTYTYAVTATTSHGETLPSKIASATPSVAADHQEVGPEQLTAVAGNAMVTLEWSPVVGVDSYTLYVWAGIASTSSADAVRITSVSSPYKHEQLQNGTTYTYAVTATTSRGETLLSSIVSATPSVTADHQAVGPEQLTAVAGNAMVTLEWSPVVGADSYTLYVWAGIASTSSADAVRITSVSSPYKHEQLQNGTTYTYAVTATTSHGETLPSKIASAKPELPPLPAPQGLVAVAGDGSVKLTWTEEVNTTYTLLWSKDAALANPTSIANVNTGHEHKGLDNGVPYFYALVATRAGADSPRSTTATATPNPQAAAGDLTAVDTGVATGSSVGVEVKWSEVPGATRYHLVWEPSSPGGTGGDAWINAPATTATIDIPGCAQYSATVQVEGLAGLSALSLPVPVRGCPGKCSGPVEFNQARVVDMTSGTGTPGGRGECQPYKTIEEALSLSTSGETVWIRKRDKNDLFPITKTLMIPAGVRLVGDHEGTPVNARTPVIDGYEYPNYTIAAGDGSSIEGLIVHGHRDFAAINIDASFEVKNSLIKRAKVGLRARTTGATLTITNSILRENTFGVEFLGKLLTIKGGSQLILNRESGLLLGTVNQEVSVDGSQGNNVFRCNAKFDFDLNMSSMLHLNVSGAVLDHAGVDASSCNNTKCYGTDFGYYPDRSNERFLDLIANGVTMGETPCSRL